MRVSERLRFEPASARAFEYSGLGWLQAGFGSFAYRLAHLHAPRATLVSVLAMLFFFA
jgi:hypothetical protein